MLAQVWTLPHERKCETKNVNYKVYIGWVRDLLLEVRIDFHQDNYQRRKLLQMNKKCYILAYLLLVQR